MHGFPQESGQDVPYTNREIREKWHDIANSLTRIEVQTTTTNGKVRTLQLWRAGLVGAFSILTAVVVPVLIWALTILVSIDAKIQESVDRALSSYEITK